MYLDYQSGKRTRLIAIPTCFAAHRAAQVAIGPITPPETWFNSCSVKTFMINPHNKLVIKKFLLICRLSIFIHIPYHTYNDTSD